MPKKIPVFVFTLSLAWSNYTIAETILPVNAAINENDQPILDASTQTSSATQDPAELHAQHCVACHINITDGDGSVIYTRSDRLARNDAELLYWVTHFSNGLRLELDDTELEALTNFIKNSYYQTDQQQ